MSSGSAVFTTLVKATVPNAGATWVRYDLGTLSLRSRYTHGTISLHSRCTLAALSLHLVQSRATVLSRWPSAKVVSAVRVGLSGTFEEGASCHIGPWARWREVGSSRG